MAFQGTKHIYTSEYTVTINPSEFNSTNNPTAMEVSNSAFTGFLSPILTGSGWSPYFNSLGFYDEYDQCVAIV